MRKNRKITIGVVVGVLGLTIAGLVFLFISTSMIIKFKSGGENNLDKFNTELPATVHVTKEEAKANGGGWYVSMDENFSSDSMPEYWNPAPHGKRGDGNWCANMIHFEDGECVIYSAILDDNECDICPREGIFTGGIVTRGTENVPGFEQAFGYFEARVKIPKNEGIWSAFWIQTDAMGKIGNDGRDGMEIDVYESSFLPYPTYVGHALHYDSYGADHRLEDYIVDTGRDQYDGYHTYALKWTPDEYVWYVDGVPTYASNFGGVSRVTEFLKLTCEVRGATGFGPYGVTLKPFVNTKENPAKFYVDYVKVYQNTEFESSIQEHDEFTTSK